MKLKATEAKRFWSKVLKDCWLYPSGCWIWVGQQTEAGYGNFRYRRKRNYAHRISYRIAKGPIPKDMEIDHLCRVTSCVNPDHLEAVTHRENMLRGNTPAARNAAKTHCPDGHPLSGENLYIRKGKRGCLTCRRKQSREHGKALRARINNQVQYKALEAR